MNTERRQIQVGDLSVEVVRKAIRNLHLGVYPPDGHVRVASPLAASDDVVRLAVVRRLRWIKAQQAKFAAQPRQSQRQMVSGESHYFLGRRYRLRVLRSDGPGRIALRNRTTIELHAHAGSDAAERERVLLGWYRARLRELIPPLMVKWTAILGVYPTSWRIRRMKTKWGACSGEDRRIWLNLELAKKPVQCLEYSIVHELAHLLEWHHTDRFVAIMDRHLPRWRLSKQELAAAPLRHDTWRQARTARNAVRGDIRRSAGHA